MSGHDEQLPARLTARVEEQHDDRGDLVWALTVLALTYDRRVLDRVADAIGCELLFVPVGRWSA